MIIASILVVLTGGWLLLAGLVMLASPTTAKRFIGKMASTNLINYTEILLRIIAGIALVLAAKNARYPDVFLIFGWLLILTSIALLFVPRAWHARFAVYWSQHLNAFMIRLCALVALLMGGMLIHGVL